MDKKQQTAFLTNACEELEISQEQLSKRLRVSPKFLKDWLQGNRLMEHDSIQRLEALLVEHRHEQMAALNLQNEMELFCHQARITESQLAQLMGLNSVNQLYQIYRQKPLPHVLHFILLKREQKLSQKTGKRFRLHMESVHHQVLPVRK